MQNTHEIALQRISVALKKKATQLDLSGLGLKQLPPEILQLKQLQQLNIASNELTQLTADIGTFSQLKVLNAANNQISQISKAIRKLHQLNTLNLSNNKLNTIARELGQLYHLQHLNLSHNNFTDIPRAVKYLNKLTHLLISHNKLARLPENIEQLQSLNVLQIQHNNIGKLPTNIGKLNTLQVLDASYNQISVIPSSLGQLKHLAYLYLAKNQIHQIPNTFSQLVQLKHLNLAHNFIANIPPTLSQLKQLKEGQDSYGQATNGLLLQGNRFNIPTEIYKRTPSQIIQYLLDLQASKLNKPLHEAKLIFIGSGFVGKTSLINMLTQSTYNPNEQKTDGIQITDWHINRGGDSIKLHVWDFGGQEIMHATHKFFMTGRSVYVLVINPRTEDKYGDSELEYWLKLIRSYAGKEVPIVVCINKCETHKIDVPKGEIQDKYSNVLGFVETSCVKNTGIGRLERAIKRAVAQMEHIDEVLPQSYFDIKKQLEEMNADYIPYRGYQQICRQVDPQFGEESMLTLMRLLHDLGVMLNFDDDRRLMDTQVLNPEWVTKGVYQIIISERLVKKKGILTMREITRILNKQTYPGERERAYIMDIMDRFELCYQVPHLRDTFFVPGAFPKDRPNINWQFKPTAMLRFQYHYDVMPSSIMSLFIVKVHEFIRGRDYWRNGVVIRKNNTDAFVKADPEERKIFIEVVGKGSRREMLAFIRSQFDILHARLSNIAVQSKIPVDAQGQVVLDYEDLLFYEEIGEESMPVRELRTRINIKQLLNGIEHAGAREHYRNTNWAMQEPLNQVQGLLNTPNPTNANVSKQEVANKWERLKTNQWVRYLEILGTLLLTIVFFLAALSELTGLNLFDILDMMRKQ